MGAPSQHAAQACRNCGAALVGTLPPRFCPQCGQETALHPPTLREFAHEFIGHYVALEGALWKTLGLLFFRPGRLTIEYLAGRRRRYVLPLRLYITASFLFFLVVKLLPAPDLQLELKRGGEVEATVPSAPASAAACDEGNDCLAAKTNERWGGDPKVASERLQARLFATAPYAVFLMLPVFAAIVMLAYRRRHKFYGEHVVFALHMHSFGFLALAAMSLLPFDAMAAGTAMIGGYSVWALHTVYGGRWSATLWRALFIALLYGTALLLATMLLVVAVLLT